MKKILYLLGGLVAAGILSRLPHPAVDVSRLEPVQVVYLYLDQGRLWLETDTGSFGSGDSLTEAANDLKANASGEIFLDTAEFLILDPEVPIEPDFYDHLRPGCKVCYADAPPDLTVAAAFLATHSPEITLAHLRPQRITH